MSETAEAAVWQQQLATLRDSGAAARDPIRFAFLAALTQRAARQSAPIRRFLSPRINALLQEITRLPEPSPAPTDPASTVSPLGELLAYIAQHAPILPDHDNFTVNPAGKPISPAENLAGQPLSLSFSLSLSPTPSNPGNPPAPELKSVTYFRQEWSKLSTEQQLTQTLAQAPENAGPMNSQHLVLQSLQVMHDIAPDYLQGFMSYIDTLIWLEHADPSKPATRPNQAKSDSTLKGKRARNR